MKQLLLLLFFCFGLFSLYAQIPKQFSYQSVLRNGDGETINNQDVSIRVNIVNTNNQSYFEEIHSVRTNNLGLVNLQIGSRNTVEMDAIDWSQDTYFLEVSFDPNGGNNYELMGRIQILAVPYAFLAEEVVNERDGDVTNELQNLSFNNSNNELTISNGNTITLPSGVADSDGDPNNEIQSLTYNSTTNVLSISDGNSVTLNSGGGGTDNDEDPLNEIQTISKSGSTVTLSNGGGSFTDDTADEDADPSNEIQSLTFDPDNNMLSISGGNEITIPGGSADADADPNNEIQSLTFNASTNVLSISEGNSVTLNSDGGSDNDDDPSNEIQSLTFNSSTNVLTISDGNSVTLNSGGGGTDNDEDPTNEIQTITKSGSTVTLSNGGGSFTDEVGDASTTNEIQSLSFNTSTNVLSISDGNSVTLNSGGGGGDNDEDPSNEIQTISKNGSTVTLSNGGGSFTDEVEDSDASLTNELQRLSINDNTLSLLNFDGSTYSSVNLPNGSSGGGLWSQNGSNIFYNNGQVSVGTNATFSGSTFNVANTLSLLNSSDLLRGQFYNHPTLDVGLLNTFGPNGSLNLDFSYLVESGTNYPNYGGFGLHDDQGIARIAMYPRLGRYGEMWFTGPNGNFNLLFSGLSDTYPNKGSIRAYDNGFVKAEMFASVDNTGTFASWGGNNSLNAVIGTTISGNSGYIGVYGPTATFSSLPEVQLFVDDFNNGAIYITGTYGGGLSTTGCFYIDQSFGATLAIDLKQFVMDHPQEKDKEIIYACIEGPEAGAYARGSGELENGKVFITYPNHFRMVVHGEEATIQLTPLSIDTYGLAVTQKTETGFWVQELKGGNGNFQFDWEAKAVRKGYENYEPVRIKRTLNKTSPYPSEEE